MPKLPAPKDGKTLYVKDRLLPFSFFPVKRDKKRYGLYDSVFAMSPWAVMEAAVRSRVSDADLRSEALAFLEQAQDFHASATSRLAANPLLLYYSFLNLGKALLLTLGHPTTLDRAAHGLSEQRLATGVELDDSVVVVTNTGNRVNVYAELIDRLGFARPSAGDTYPVPELLSQIVVGHRIWREADKANTERFIGLYSIEIVDSRPTKELWLRLYVPKGDLKRYGITRERLLNQGDLAGTFHEVDTTAMALPKGVYACFEQDTAVTYTGWPTDVVMDLVGNVRPRLWRIVTTTPEYRKYYLHLSPPGTVRLPQIASLWTLFFYFGSIVRYRPHLFDVVARGKYGAFVTEFISAQSEQLLYLLASEMCTREIARPAII